MIDLHMLGTLAAILFATGLVAGMLAGLLGVGGGIVMVPVLFYVFGALDQVDESVRMHMAVGTSLAVMIPTSVRSVMAHYSRGAIDWSLFRRWLPGLVLGVAAGAATAAHVDGRVLMTVFGSFATAVALHMAFGRESWRIADRLPGRWVQNGMASLISGISVMMGIGGGTFTVPVLTLFGYPIHRAVATAAAVGTLIAIPGAVAFVLSGLGVPGRPIGSLGYASLIGCAVMVPATVIAAPWGARLAYILSRVWLRRAFALFLAVTGVKMLLT